MYPARCFGAKKGGYRAAFFYRRGYVDCPDGPLEQLLGSSITYRIAVGPQQGRKVFTLPASGEPFADGVGKVAGFSLHAGVAARADQRQKLERLCRYISRPAISEKRLSLTPDGNVR